MSSLQSVTAVTIAANFITGMVWAALLGSIKLPLAKRLRIGETKVGGLLSALALALSPMLLLSGILIDQLGVQAVVLAGSFVTALSLFALAFSQHYAGALWALFLAGAGTACLNNVGIVLTAKAFFPDNAAASANLGNAFYGLGALATPTLAERLIRGLGFRQALSVLGGVSLVPALLAGLTQTEAFAVSGEPGNVWAVLPSPLLWLVSLAGFLYVPLESGLSTWATTYLTDLGAAERRAALLLSGFWFVFVASQLLVALLEHQGVFPRGSEPWQLVGLAVASALSLGGMVRSRRQGAGACGLLLAGACFGPIFPLLMAIIYGSFAERDLGTAAGVLCALSVVGPASLAPLIGARAQRTSVRQALQIPVVVALALAAVGLSLGLLRPFLAQR